MTTGLLIPRILHRIWLGGPVPEAFAAYEAGWREHHPGWELRTWNEDTLPPLRNQEAFDAATSMAMKADLARYELLLDQGGVYLDCDMECRRNLEPLLDGVRAFAAREDEHLVNVAILGAVPGHPLFAAAVREAPRRITALPGAPTNEQTGPLMLTSLIDRLDTDAVVFGPERFYPYHFTEPERAGEDFPEAYAIHRWAHSWSDELARPTGPLRVAVALDVDAPDASRPLLAAYAALFAEGDPVELALVVLDGIEAAGAERVAATAQALCAEHAVAGEVVAYEPAELVDMPLTAAAGPGDGAAATARELADAIARLCQLRLFLDGLATVPPGPLPRQPAWLTR